MPPNLLIILLFLAISLVGAGVVLAVRDYLITRRQAINERLGLPETFLRKRLDAPETPVGSSPMDAKMRRSDWFEQLVLGSGLPLSPEAAFLLSLLLGLVLGGSLFLWKENFALAACGMAAGMLLVILYLVLRRNSRRRAFQLQLPDAVSLLSRSVHAGESLEQGLRLVAQHTEDPLASELRQCNMQFDMGLSVEAAMRGLTRRVPLAEMQLLASTLVVQHRAGGHLASTLDTLVRVLRDRLSFQRHFHSATAVARLSVIVIGLGGPLIAMAMWTWQPQYLRLLTSSFEGRTLLLIAGILYLVGSIWALRLLRTNY